MPKSGTQTALAPKMVIPALKALAKPFAGHAELWADQQEVEHFLEECFGPDAGKMAPPVTQAMRHAVLGEAQRIRPVLALRLARMVGAETRLVMRAAAAAEIPHCASLIVDDLPSMDNELMRRGIAGGRLKTPSSSTF